MPSNLEQYAADHNLDMSVAGAVLAHAIEQKAISGNKGRPVELTLEELGIDNVMSLTTVADVIDAVNGRINTLLAEFLIEGRGEEVVWDEYEKEPYPRIPHGLKRDGQLIISSLHNVLRWVGKK